MRNRVSAGVAVVLALGAVQACGGEGVRVSTAPEISGPTVCVGHQPVGSLPDRDDGTPLMRVVVHVDNLAQKRYAAVYTGLSVDEDDSAADIWRIPSDAFDAAVCDAAVKGVTLRLHDTDISRKTLNKLSDRIGDDMSRWDGSFRMREVGVDERGFVRVGVDDPDKAEPIMKKAYGAENARYIKVEYADQAELLDAG
ncbi:hypothetical protein [Streptomyces pseudovenezuelae]|uniref:Lipoprotein n=1 Tax=Streptomyces pseudovenezuelae TaxID=67350 RepID=A0ABT6LNB5_9ACTN|nr:hypothetical protein [Streptomyces pseudovenezuelae]MDH6217794.1 hypothetical protein [Streptomyces pseudovenezuelae]